MNDDKISSFDSGRHTAASWHQSMNNSGEDYFFSTDHNKIDRTKIHELGSAMVDKVKKNKYESMPDSFTAYFKHNGNDVVYRQTIHGTDSIGRKSPYVQVLYGKGATLDDMPTHEAHPGLHRDSGGARVVFDKSRTFRQGRKTIPIALIGLGLAGSAAAAKLMHDYQKTASDHDGHGVWNCDECGKYIRSCKCMSSNRCSDQKYTETCQDCRDGHITKEAADLRAITRYIEAAKKDINIVRPPRSQQQRYQNIGHFNSAPSNKVGIQHRGDIIRMGRKSGLGAGDEYTPVEKHLINKVSIAHEIFEHAHDSAGIPRKMLRWEGHEAPSILLREHNLIRDLTGPGSDGAKRYFSQMRGHGGESDKLRDFAGHDFQYGKSKKVSMDHREMADSDYAQKRMAQVGVNLNKTASERGHKDTWTALIGMRKHADVAGGEPSQTVAQGDVGIEPPPPPQTEQAMAHTTGQAMQQNIAMKHLSRPNKPQLPPRRIPHNWVPR